MPGVPETRRGVAAGIAAYTIWGLFPLYWPLLKPAGALEILAHRMLWSLAVVLIILAVQRHWAWIRALRPRRLALLTLAAALIGVNWGVYIYAVNNGHTIEAALGYFITPLVSVMLGVAIFRERLRRWQWGAVGLAVVAVAILAAAYGRPPWIALILAGTFGSYGLVKKTAATPSVESLTVETAVLFPVALAYTLLAPHQTFTGHGLPHAALLAGAGVVTAVPLMLFNTSATRVPLSVLGLLQYLTPVLQFLIGLLIQHEPMPASRWAGFLLVWAALIVLTADGLRAARSRRRTPAPAEPVADAA